MSSNRRPWYPWYPKDFVADEKVQCLPPLAELIYRRALDLMWQSNSIRIPFAIDLLWQSLGRGIAKSDFAIAWERIMYPDFELFSVSDDEKWLYSDRLRREADHLVELSEKRKNAGKTGSNARWKDSKIANAKQTHSKRIANAKQKDSYTHTHTDTDKKKKDITRVRATTIPDDFILSEKLTEYAIQKGVNKHRVETIFEHFISHHTAKRSLFVDWTAAWRTWVLNDLRFNKLENGGLTESEKKQREQACKEYEALHENNG